MTATPHAPPTTALGKSPGAPPIAAKPSAVTKSSASRKPSTPAEPTIPTMPAVPVEAPLAHLIVFGRDEAGRAHAAWFTAEAAPLAIKAAGLMGLATLVVGDEAARAEAIKLPQGRVFASGRAFVPLAKTAAYDRLKALAGHAGPEVAATAKPAPAPAAPTPPATPKRSSSNGGASAVPPAVKPGPVARPGAVAPAPVVEAPHAGSDHRPADWGAIGVGSLVLAPEHDGISWWAAVVMRVEGERFTLKWRDFWHEPPFERRLDQLALLQPPPAAA